MRNWIIAAVIVIIVLVGGIFILHKPSQHNTSSTTTTPTNSPTPATHSTDTSTQSAQNTITYGNGKFSPSSLTVKSGSMVTIVNKESDAIQMDSDPHPTHTDDTDLNVGTVDGGQSKTFTVTKVGTFGYHNHLNPAEIGRITITQ